jgi:hypothetical protein
MVTRAIFLLGGHNVDGLADAPSLISGGVVSVTTTVALQVAEFPAASFTVIVTSVLPGPTIAPAAGDWVIDIDVEQLSVATISLVRSGTAA